MLFENRSEAGRLLASRLQTFQNQPDTVVLALPRGGVPVAHEVARALNLPLDVFLVRKLGVPGHEELAMGAIASGGVRILNEDVIRQLNIPRRLIKAVTQEQQRELDRREKLYRGSRPALDLRGKTVIIIDDGLATGATMKASIASIRQQNPAKVIVAAPVAARETYESLRMEADELICAATADPFGAVGAWYQEFDETTDDEVRELISSGFPDAA
jgi:predicted phosphoribosyltransferase